MLSQPLPSQIEGLWPVGKGIGPREQYQGPLDFWNTGLYPDQALHKPKAPGASPTHVEHIRSNPAHLVNLFQLWLKLKILII